MCGIGGQSVFSGAPVSRANLQLASENLRHRGPDGEGIEVRGPIGLSHRRLSIIDLDTGHQPMFNEDGQVAVTFNGELYNYRELRQELVSYGHKFRTRSDTEVIVHGWEEWGIRCVERFRGMFALAVADWKRRELFLARDQLGIKPLYYTLDSTRLAFASEMQSLRVLRDIEFTIDPTAIDEYLQLLYIPAPRTIYRGVSKLPPAHRMVVNFDGTCRGPERYWRVKFEPVAGRSQDEWSERLEEVLRDSVRSHLISDVPFGAFLSGGLDSTAVVGWMTQELTQPVKTFSIGFDEEDFSELGYARAVSRKWGTEHHEEVVRAEALNILPDLVRHYGEPFGDVSAIPTYYVSRMARRHVKMVLSGDGGDEALAGYGRYQGWKRYFEPKYPHRPLWKRLARPTLQRLWPDRFPRDGRLPQGTGVTWLKRMQSFGDVERRMLWRPEYHGAMSDSVPAFDEAFSAATDCPVESLAQYLDYQTYLPGDILTKVDIASMLHSLEVRTPLVDVRVAEFAGTIPFDVSLQVGPNGTWSGKRLLKQILSRDFDDAFLNRPKTGFVAPLKHWFSAGRVNRQEVEQRLLASDAHIASLFEPTAVAKLFSEHDTKYRDCSQQIWQLLFLEEWLAWDASSTRTKPSASQRSGTIN